MSPDETPYLVMGLPGTGKTTFLAALWHVVNSREISGSLVLDRLEGNREHVTALCNDWLSCREIARTPTAAQKLVNMSLRESDSTVPKRVVFPDLSGELFSQQWKDRAWTQEYDEMARASAGALLFVHSEKIAEPTKIGTLLALASEIEPESQTAAREEEVETTAAAWDAELAPTQVKLVDILQFLHMRSSSDLPLRLAVLVSAWDRVAEDGVSPSDWLKRRLPLLRQFLETNEELFETRTYGVSAQGGDLREDGGRLQQASPPSERIMVVAGDAVDTVSHDISDPIRWLMQK